MEASTNRNNPAFYFHIPFCTVKCGYCGFYSLPWDSETRGLAEPIISRTEKELLSRYTDMGSPPAETVYIGGGTPSALPAELLERFIHSIGRTLEGRVREWTVEVNPESLDIELLSMLKRSPVNRLSLGVQAATPGVLTFLQRTAGVEDILRAAALLKDHWPGRLSIDLMYGIPGQDEEDVRRSFEVVELFDAEHISLYGLTVEPGTPLAERRIFVDEAESIRIWSIFNRELTKRGFDRYEVSNYARREPLRTAEKVQTDIPRVSLHNLKYWRYEPYLGCGPGAHSTLVTGEETIRIENTADIDRYLKVGEPGFGASRSVLNGNERMLEFLLMGFRLTEGIGHARFEELFGHPFREYFEDILEEWMNEGLVISGPRHTAFTERGMWIMNTLLVRLARRIDEILPA